MRELDGNTSVRYMHFEKMLPSAQGMGIWEYYAFILYDTGTCGVYNLKTKDPNPIGYFSLGSYNDGVPTKDYLNHANSCMFGSKHLGNNPIPLLYVNTGTGTGYDQDGYYYRCAIENIICKVEACGERVFHAETVQVISYYPEGIEKTIYEQPCWGCPCWMVDTEKELLYMFSAQYRTTRGNVPDGERNRYIITTFRLPDLNAGKYVRLTACDIIDQFSCESDIQFTQGGTIIGKNLYYTFGCPRLNYPLRIAVFDLEKREMSAIVDNLDIAFGYEEVECCAQYGGHLLCNTCDGSIFVVGEGVLPLGQ